MDFIKQNWKKILIVALVVIAGYIFYKSTTSTAAQNVAVKEIKVENRVVEKTLTASGSVKSKDEAVLSFNTLGKVTAISVQEGDKVVQGQHLASLDAYSASQNSDSAKIGLEIAEKELAIYMETYQDNTDLVGGVDEYWLNVRKLESAVQKTRAAYNSVAGGLSNYYIYAPFDGTIVDVAKYKGETAAATERIIKIADLDNLYLEVSLDQEDFGLVKMGQTAHIELDSFPNKVINGYVDEIPSYADITTDHNFVVRVRLQNGDPDTKVLLGMTGDTNIVVDKTENEVSSLIYDEVFYDELNNPFVWTVVEGTLRKQPIEIGLEGDLYTEIKSQITNTIVIPLNNTVEIKEGYKARLSN